MEVVYVTVGTTKFDALINKVTSERILNILKLRGCKLLILQIGTGTEIIDREAKETKYGIKIQQYRFKFEPVRLDIINSDLTIGHAGAGTCLDVLQCKKPGILVANSELMSDHQTELAEQLANDNYMCYCKLDELGECLETLNLGRLKTYEPDTNNMETFVQYLNKMFN